MTGPVQPTAWLASFAVGLAYTERDDANCLRQLLDVAPSAVELRAARRLLAGWEMADTDRHARALALIDQGLAATLHATSHQVPARRRPLPRTASSSGKPAHPWRPVVPEATVMGWQNTT